MLGATVLLALVGAVTASPSAAQELSAGDRITIMVPDLAPRNDADNDFGEDVADELRDLINELHTHQTVSGRDIRRARREFDLAHEDLFNCISARQLAMRQNWGLVLCGEYEEVGDRQVRVNAKFVGSGDGNEFEVPQFTASEREPEEAAQKILQTFDRWQTQLRHTVFCQQYMDSQSWDDALRNCNQALEINPTSKQALYKKAFILRETDRHQESLETLDRLLEIDPIHQDALKLAGIIATEADMPGEAREYFDRYMELNPGDVGVRLKIATDISNAGDPATAMEFAQEGVEVAPEDLTLITYIGHFAAQAAGKAEAQVNAQQQGEAEAGPEIDPMKVTEYYQTAADSYRQVFEAQADSTDPQILERLVVSLFKLGQYEEAVELGQQATAIVPDNAAVWEAYSRALQEAGQLEEAMAAIQRTEELGRTSPALTQRKAMLQLQQGDEDAAVQVLSQAVEDETMEASAAFNIVFANAYGQKYQNGQHDAALALLDAAGPLAQAEKDQLTRNFWRGYIMFEKGKAAHEPMTAESAQRAKPLFERALELFQAARGYEQYHASANVPQLIDAAQRYIEIEEALIKRGR
jgi:tetratricopeptide (TPR) repeat protein